MTDGDEYSVEAAREAGERGQLADWVTRFLASPGSDNPELAVSLADPPRWWLGPLQVPLDRLHRLVGPPDAPVVHAVEEDDWGEDVDELAERVEDAWEPPPVVASYRGGQLVLEDGNHRVEGLRRAGRDRAWAVIGFEDRDERDRFVAPSPA